MKRIARITIRGIAFTVYRQATVIVDGEEVDASCDPPTKRGRTIRIREGMTPKREMDVLIHEMLHAAFWDLAEEAIAETATDIQAALEQLGYRKQ